MARRTDPTITVRLESDQMDAIEQCRSMTGCNRTQIVGEAIMLYRIALQRGIVTPGVETDPKKLRDLA